MEINLLHVIIAVSLVGVINLITTVFLKSKVSNLQSKLDEQTKASNIKNAKETAELKVTVEQGTKAINTAVLAINKDISSSLSKTEENIIGCYSQVQAELKSVVLTLSTFKENSKAQNESILSLLTNSSSALLENQKISTNTINNSINEIEKSQKTLAFSHKQEQLSNFEQLTKSIHTLRIENTIEITNELGKHTELTVDTEEFTKQLGNCKVLKITDKHSGQVTQVYYENGVKRSSDTFANEQLKYQMFYSADGNPEKGLEFNGQEQIVFEYLYDEAGEINQRTEFSFDESGKGQKPTVKAY
ncbi:hypothetical protein [Shewanella sp. 10N.286.48.A6]|uniref:hypothetical protein n=1 Tax=Shewanella sp. 10N.286.48.A6 TaxID=1880833 RepID=UPI000C82AC25|nr:hypothetical protein [Shewanella sp. 10N.286.48.A6]PMI01883.1 hypothetical protein BCU55_09395 [Shewanella sp. 10N.286.48.A6]